MKRKAEASPNQVVGNVGLFYVCYQLSRAGWNVMPTARNARGIDIVIYSQDATRTHTLQVKTLSKRSPVPLGGSRDRLFGDFFVICRNVATTSPESFILQPAEVRSRIHRGEKEGRVSYWLQPKDYALEQFREAWNRIGSGLADASEKPKPIGGTGTPEELSSLRYPSEGSQKGQR